MFPSYVPITIVNCFCISGCQTQEKVVATAAKDFIVIADNRCLYFHNQSCLCYFSLYLARSLLTQVKRYIHYCYHGDVLFVNSGIEDCRQKSCHLRIKLSRLKQKEHLEVLLIFAWLLRKQYVNEIKLNSYTNLVVKTLNNIKYLLMTSLDTHQTIVM